MVKTVLISESARGEAVSSEMDCGGSGKMIRRDHPQHFFTQDEAERLARTIRDVEARATGQVQIFLEWNCPLTDPMSRSIKLFHRLKLHTLPNQNGILIYIATQHRLFAVIADRGISEKIKNPFWTGLHALMEHRFKQGQFLEGTLLAIEELGRRLLEVFPAKR